MKFYSEKLNKMYDSAAEVVQAEEAYDKKLAKIMPKAYRKFLQSGIIEVDQILGK